MMTVSCDSELGTLARVNNVLSANRVTCFGSYLADTAILTLSKFEISRFRRFKQVELAFEVPEERLGF